MKTLTPRQLFLVIPVLFYGLNAQAATEKMAPVAFETKAPMEFGAAEGGLPADVKTPALKIRQGIEAPVEIPAVQASKKETIDDDGKRTVEEFDGEIRKQMQKFDSQDRLLESWMFDKETGRILRYAKYQYGKGGLSGYRTAEWTYDPAGDSSKVSRIFNGKNEMTSFSVEYTSAAGVKYCEQWFNADNELTSQEIWDRETGEFKQHVLVKPYLLSKKIQWLDENKNKIREAVVPRGHGLFGKIGFGKTYDTGYDTLRDKDREAYRAARSDLV
ncbi:MAG TPA: hypothetical protein VL688_09900 [Verrucomicrobiae bacterium]|jgi:hypothetical protein|nr:hypothetical protein [Verrucomicrobiae bacterium]